MKRVVCWFSAGAASAVAAHLALSRTTTPAVVVRIWIADEHPDNERFTDETARWLGVPIATVSAIKYQNTNAVFNHRRYIVGPAGAPCTLELKRRVREYVQEPGDLHVFGYDVSEQDRAARFSAAHPELDVWYPLIETGYSKADCYATLQRAGIELPAMYRLGFKNNNCIGCVKGGIGYWQRVKKEFPAVFAERAALEQEIGASILHRNGERLWLRDLPAAPVPEAAIQCGLLCDMAANEVQV